ncbi:hypothetical protein BGZ65_007567 [Modicella reniformis]|uniref:Uncharacterized protein n=1 Tax=Modicella reniformis TaxID=1440133 RepID=A0A9P6IJT7_9FUNG|nr:hypothetical protein BGZ65_007567 [Modicella reniformis]
MAQQKENQHSLRLEEQHFHVLDSAWEEAKKELNYWNRMLTGAKVKDKDDDNNKKKNSTSTITTPTWQLPRAEDIPQRLDLKEIFANHRTTSRANRTRIVTTWAEDPGVKTLSENVFLTVEGIKESLNRFHVLQDLEEEQVIEKPEPWTPLQRQQAREQVKELKIPKAHRITARQVEEVSFGRRERKTREQLLKENKYHSAKTGLEGICKPDVSLSTASTLEQVSAAIKAHTPVIKDIRQFNQDPALVKLRRTKRHRTTRAWARLTSNLRAMATDHTIQRLTPQERGVPSVDHSTGYCSGCKAYEVSKCDSYGVKQIFF